MTAGEKTLRISRKIKTTSHTHTGPAKERSKRSRRNEAETKIRTVYGLDKKRNLLKERGSTAAAFLPLAASTAYFSFFFFSGPQQRAGRTENRQRTHERRVVCEVGGEKPPPTEMRKGKAAGRCYFPGKTARARNLFFPRAEGGANERARRRTKK